MTSYEIENLTKRHIGRILSRLDEINISKIVKDSVKGEFWLMSDDIKSLLELEQSGEHNNDFQETNGNR
jgi:hypothetical protein